MALKDTSTPGASRGSFAPCRTGGSMGNHDSHSSFPRPLTLSNCQLRSHNTRHATVPF